VGTVHLGDPGVDGGSNIETDVGEIVCEDVNWIKVCVLIRKKSTFTLM
jgi:hypothetical protein